MFVFQGLCGSRCTHIRGSGKKTFFYKVLNFKWENHISNKAGEPVLIPDACPGGSGGRRGHGLVGQAGAATASEGEWSHRASPTVQGGAVRPQALSRTTPAVFH